MLRKATEQAFIPAISTEPEAEAEPDPEGWQ